MLAMLWASPNSDCSPEGTAILQARRAASHLPVRVFPGDTLPPFGYFFSTGPTGLLITAWRGPTLQASGSTHTCVACLLLPAFLPPKGSGSDRLTQPFPDSYSPDLPRLCLPGATQVIGRQRFPT